MKERELSVYEFLSFMVFCGGSILAPSAYIYYVAVKDFEGYIIGMMFAIFSILAAIYIRDLGKK